MAAVSHLKNKKEAKQREGIEKVSGLIMQHPLAFCRNYCQARLTRNCQAHGLGPG